MPSTTTNRRRRLPRWLVPLCVVLASAAPAFAQQHIPQPRLNAVFPIGGKVGTELELKFTGEALEGAQQLVFTHPSITAAPVMTAPDRFYPQPRPAENRFTVRVGPDVPPGFYEVRVANRLGLSNARGFVVGDLPEVVETSPNQDTKTATEIAVNSVVNGTCNERSFDYFSFKAAKG